ncbi:hypothetical protein ONE63_002376 [Megalurothrips usitatus]|uniref:Uncharacterized protein n=1 Tax=Megalurothrips usitatus TaxID=439358 RepID=A0AAV7XBQ1_9NEOP|nr:hypothetical protein ONE63_002376 [Megalurothrips usitatus]
MFRVAAFLLVCACQLAASSEDYDWGDAQTAVWAIARENKIVADLHQEAAALVEELARNATLSADKLVADHVASWKAPVDEAIAAAAAVGIDIVKEDRCSVYRDWKIPTGQVKSAVPLCVVAARAQWDAQVSGLKAAADDMLELLIKVQAQSKSCDNRYGSLLQALCRQTEVTRTVLTAQDDKSKKGVSPYWSIVSGATASIPQDATACVQGAFGRADLAATNSAENAVRCINDLIKKRKQ